MARGISLLHRAPLAKLMIQVAIADILNRVTHLQRDLSVPLA